MVSKIRTSFIIPAALAGLTLIPVDGAHAATWSVGPGGDYSTIQSAIADVNTLFGDVILVAPGTYNETIDFLGKGITIRSTDGPEVTIIDATGAGDPAEHSVVTAENDEDEFSELDGFTLTGGTGTQAGFLKFGGAIYNKLTGPTYRNLIIRDNEATDGGAVYTQFGGPVFQNCLFTGNEQFSTVIGGGSVMYNDLAAPILKNCTLTGNIGEAGGAIYNSQSSPRLISCIVWNNESGSFGGSATSIVSHSDIQGGFSGQGNFDMDPMFVDADGPDDIPGTADDDCSLQPGSPCIDAGDSPALAQEEPRDLNGARRGVDDPDTVDIGVPVFDIVIDIGCYEFQVGGGDCTNDCPWDLRGAQPTVPDGQVGFADLNELLIHWGACP